MSGPTSVTFDWRDANDTIRYGLTSAYGLAATGRTPSPLPFSSPGPFWEARLDDLLPGATYHYSIAGGPDHVFRVPPAPGIPSTFTVYVEGDVGDAGTYPRVAAVQQLVADGHPDFVLLVGDLSYANAHGQAAVDRHFNDMMVWSQDAAYMPVWGNHEWDSGADDLRNYKGRFELPNPQTSPGAPALGCCGEDWSWFDYGGVRFISYPEPFPGAWSDWNTRVKPIMDEAEADPTIHFVVTFGHRPPWSSGHHPGEATLAGYMATLALDHSKYVLDLSGHSHNYERTTPQNGVIHMTVGIGGSTLEEDPVGNCLWKGGCPKPSWSAFRAMHHGVLRLTFGPTSIVGEAICGPAGDSGANRNDVECAYGDVFDSFLIGNSFVDIPPALPDAGPALETVRPNPARDGLAVDYALADGSPASVEILDAAGHIVVRRDLGSPGPGRHSFHLDRSPDMAPGLYWLRLTQARSTHTAKVVFLR